jgi:glutamyl/glutaminyl-tRNA synthetase
MEISHIMRGDEWLPSVPKHVLLYNAFGWEIPIYAHLPLILAPTGKGKLSKRHGGVEIRDFRKQGYLPEAMVNYLARIGWSHDDKTEIFQREELIRYFDLAGINNSPARFSYERLEWMNAYYIRQLEADDLAARLVPFLREAGFEVTAADVSDIAISMASERAEKAGVKINFHNTDFWTEGLDEGEFDFVFDRGYFHSHKTDKKRKKFASKVFRQLKAGGLWLSLVGSCDSPPRASGPPMHSATEIVKGVEPYFEILMLKASRFGSDMKEPAKNWVCMMRKRDA